MPETPLTAVRVAWPLVSAFYDRLKDQPFRTSVGFREEATEVEVQYEVNSQTYRFIPYTAEAELWLMLNAP